MLDHVGFGVSDYGRSKAFYSEALAPLNIELIMEPSKLAAGFGRAGKPFFWLEGTRPPVTQVHVAFACDSRDVVDAFHEAGLPAGGTDSVTLEQVLSHFGALQPSTAGVAVRLDGQGDLADVVRALDAAQVRVADLHLHAPTLDDVFLAKTGRSLEGSEEAEPEPE